MINKALMSSASTDWATPKNLFEALDRRFSFTLDPCCSYENAKCEKYFTLETNGLVQSWQGERVFMNPPYGNEISFWVKKARQEAEQGALIVGLLPARTDTKWWQENVQGQADIRFIAGRLKFGESKNAAPFPSVIAIWWGWNSLLGRG